MVVVVVVVVVVVEVEVVVTVVGVVDCVVETVEIVEAGVVDMRGFGGASGISLIDSSVCGILCSGSLQQLPK